MLLYYTYDMKINMQLLYPIILRIGIGLVIIYFGLQQISDPSAWTAYLPRWIENLPVSDINFVYLNGYFELIFGALLILGFQTRIVSFLLSLHMLGIVLTVGYNEIGVRDFGIFVAVFAVFLHGQSGWSVDESR